MADMQLTGQEPMLQQREPVLCYVGGSYAYFTTQDLDKQWGDDWNDAPYEHNAGTPYEWYEGRDEPSWQIVTIMWAGPFDQPNAYTANSGYSVEMINRGDIAWLRPERWVSKGRPIPAGTTLSEFKKRIWEAGGQIFVEEKPSA